MVKLYTDEDSTGYNKRLAKKRFHRLNKVYRYE